MKQSQEKKKKKLFTLFCAMWHQSIQPSESELTASLYTHTHPHTHTHTQTSRRHPCVHTVY